MSRHLLVVSLVVAMPVCHAMAQCPASAPRSYQLRTFNVADLVVPIQGPGACRQANTQEASLIQLITKSVAPRTWADNGGTGTIDYHPLTKALVVNQTPDVQEQIEDLLGALRRLQEREIYLETRFVCVPEGFLDRLEKMCGASGAPRMLTDLELFLLMETVQADPKASVMQAPKMVALDGRPMQVKLGEASFIQGARRISCNGEAVVAPKREALATGLDFSIRPAILSDRRAVMIEAAAKLTGETKGLVSLTVEKKTVVPNGRTVLVRGWKIEREAIEGNETLSVLPYVGPLFRSERRTESCDVVLLITPRLAAPGMETEEKIQRAAHTTPVPPPMAAPAAPQAFPLGGAEAQEPAPKKATAKRVSQLLEKYRAACADGDRERARRLALKALELDPTCFGK
jgi:type II secretory pathway component GspD/PulD (secretin)